MTFEIANTDEICRNVAGKYGYKSTYIEPPRDHHLPHLVCHPLHQIDADTYRHRLEQVHEEPLRPVSARPMAESRELGQNDGRCWRTESKRSRMKRALSKDWTDRMSVFRGVSGVGFN